MHDPNRHAFAKIVGPIFAAEAVVAVAIFMGLAITVQGRSLWAFIAAEFIR